MKKILESLEKYGVEGKEMICADGRVRKVYPLLGAYVADYPEQCLVACTHENHCPHCSVSPKDRGRLMPSEPCQQKKTLDLLCEDHNHHSKITAAHLDKHGLHDIYPPFWADLPHVNIFSSFTPDLLHQVHKGVFKTHLVSWCESLITEGVMDYWFQSMPAHPALHHFKNGITSIKQWTGKEYKMMEKVFVGVVAGGVNNPNVVKATCALLDFICLSQLPVHTSDTLHQMDSALEEFHNSKDVFIHEGVPEHFNIPKIHSLIHYVEAIKSCGTPDGFNTESPE